MARLFARLGFGVGVSILAVSAAMAADPAKTQPAASTLGGTLGGTVFALPTFNAPPTMGSGAGSLVTDTFNILAPGGMIAVGGSFDTGMLGAYSGGINLSGFASLAKGTGSTTHTLSGDGVLYIPGITTPAGTITLNTDVTGVNPTASSAIAGTTSNQTVNVPANAGGAQNAWGTVQGTPGEFTYAGGATYNGAPTNAAVAFGAIANGTGGAFLASGNLTGVTVSTSTNVDIIYTGADLTYGLSGVISSSAAGQVYVGPSFRYLDQRYTTDISVNMAEAQPVSPANYEFPIYKQSTVEHLAATYAGGVIGASISTSLNDGWALSLNGEGGIYWANANLDATESYNISGGGNVPITNQTVTNATTVTDSKSQMAYAGRFQAILSTAISQNQQVHFGGNVEYLSAVPTITRTASAYPVTTPGAGDATYTGSSTGGTPGIGFGGMFNFGATVSLTGQF